MLFQATSPRQPCARAGTLRHHTDTQCPASWRECSAMQVISTKKAKEEPQRHWRHCGTQRFTGNWAHHWRNYRGTGGTEEHSALRETPWRKCSAQQVTCACINPPDCVRNWRLGTLPLFDIAIAMTYAPGSSIMSPLRGSVSLGLCPLLQ